MARARSRRNTAGRSGAALCAIVLLAAGCTGREKAGRQDGPRANVGGRLRLAVETNIHSLDPAIAYDTVSWPLVRLLYEGLLDYGKGTDLVPCLAEKLPEVSEDGRTYSFRLRPGVRFSNGREMVAEDFVYSLERILDPATKSPGESFFRNIVGARAFQAAREEDGELARKRGIDRERWTKPTRVQGLRTPEPYLLEVELERPDLTFLNIMAMTFAYAVPREAAEEHGDDFFRHPVGTGPFVLTEWKRGMRLRFRRREGYRVKGQPHLDGIDVMVGGDSLIHQMMFERGELDLKDGIPVPDFVRIMNAPKWSKYVAAAPGARTVYLSLNCEMQPFTDVRVRRAMNHGINKERVLKILQGRAVPARGVLPPLMPGHNPKLKGYPYAPEKARALLAEAAYPDGFSVPMWLRSDTGYEVKVGEAIQQDLAEIGVRVELRPVAFGTLIDIMGRRGGAELGLFGWTQDYPDPSNFLDVLLNGERIVEVNCNNAAFYSNPKVNALLKKAAVDTDADRRIALYQEIEQMIVDDAPWVFLYHPLRHAIRQPWLRGHEMHPVWPQRLERLWLDESDPSWKDRP